MLRGLYTATAGMRVQQIRQNHIANNLANINTHGYKRSHVGFRSFPELLMVHRGQLKRLGTLSTGVLAEVPYCHFAPGNYQETGRTTDVALHGDGFLQVRDAEGKNYFTRNGVLEINAQGFLVTASGMQVCDQQGQAIRLTTTPHINEQGVIAETSQQLGIFTFNDYSQLTRTGSGGFWRTPADNVVSVLEPHIVQGYLELSNVDLNTEMTDMMAALRAYQLNSRVLSTIDSTLEKAVNEIGKL